MARDSLLALLAAVAAVLALGVGAATLDAADLAGAQPGVAEPPAAPPPGGGGEAAGSGNAIGGGSDDCTLLCSLPVGGVPVPTVLGSGSSAALLALLVGVALVAVVLAYRATGGDATPGPGDDAGQPDPVVAPTAGQTTDPAPFQAPAENGVYRAWRALRDRLDAPPTRSPAEVAADATAAGLDRAAVATITETFRAVRYGGEQATDERERRAVDARRGLDADSADADTGGDE